MFLYVSKGLSLPYSEILNKRLMLSCNIFQSIKRGISAFILRTDKLAFQHLHFKKNQLVTMNHLFFISKGPYEVNMIVGTSTPCFGQRPRFKLHRVICFSSMGFVYVQARYGIWVHNKCETNLLFDDTMKHEFGPPVSRKFLSVKWNKIIFHLNLICLIPSTSRYVEAFPDPLELCACTLIVIIPLVK